MVPLSQFPDPVLSFPQFHQAGNVCEGLWLEGPWPYRPAGGCLCFCLMSAGLSSAAEPQVLASMMQGQAELSFGWAWVSSQLSLYMLPLQGHSQTPQSSFPSPSLSGSQALAPVQPPFHSLQRTGFKLVGSG